MSINSGLKQTCPIEPRRSTLPKTCFTSPAFFDPRRWLKTPSKLSTEAPESVFLLRPTFRRIEIFHCTATPCKPWRLGRPECALINQFFRSILIILVWIFNVPMRPHFGQKWRKLLCPKYTDSRTSVPSRKAQSISLNWCHNCWQKLLHFDRCNLSQTSRIAVQYLTNKNPQLRKLLFTYSTQPDQDLAFIFDHLSDTKTVHCHEIWWGPTKVSVCWAKPLSHQNFLQSPGS